MTNTLPAPTCTIAEARRLTEQIRVSANRAWKYLVKAHAQRAWQVMGYSTWENYLAGEFEMSRSAGYRLLDQARVVSTLSAAAGTPVLVSGRQAQEIKPILPEVVQEVAEVTAGRPSTGRESAARDVVVSRARDRRSSRHVIADPVVPGAGPESVDDQDPAALIAVLRRRVVELMMENDELRNENKELRRQVSARAVAKAPVSAQKASAASGCVHPSNRRIGTYCAACGRDVKA